MTDKEIYCFKCGKTTKFTHIDDCWITAFHVPFDTLLKIKNSINGKCLCQDCLNKMTHKNPKN